MFETSEEQARSGTAKLVGGVIAVVAVVLVVVYFAFLRQEPTSTTGAKPAGASAAKTAASGEKPDPMRDLTILKFNLHRDQTQTMAIWDIQVANRSRTQSYKDVRYATNYYNGQDAVIYHNEGTLSEVVDPSDQHTFNSINDGLYPVGATRYTIELKGAQPVQ
jgi:hypothetical protein